MPTLTRKRNITTPAKASKASKASKTANRPEKLAVVTLRLSRVAQRNINIEARKAGLTLGPYVRRMLEKTFVPETAAPIPTLHK